VDGRATETMKLLQKSIVLSLVCVLSLVPKAYCELMPGKIVPTNEARVWNSQTSTIDQIWDDGTILLKNGPTIHLPAEVIMNQEVIAAQDIVVVELNAAIHSDNRGRRTGWLLIIDGPTFPKQPELALEPTSLEEILSKAVESPQIDLPFMGALSQRLMSSRSTVALPLGRGLQLLMQEMAGFAPGGRAFLANGKEVRVSKNILPETFLEFGPRLVFVMSEADEARRFLEELKSF